LRILIKQKPDQSMQCTTTHCNMHSPRSKWTLLAAAIKHRIQCSLLTRMAHIQCTNSWPIELQTQHQQLQLSERMRNSYCMLLLLLLLLCAFTSSHRTATSISRMELLLVCGQMTTTMWNIVCHLPYGHLSIVVRPNILQQDIQWPWLAKKPFICAQ